MKTWFLTEKNRAMLNISDKQKRLVYDIFLTALIFILMLSLYAKGTFQSSTGSFSMSS